MRTVLIFLFISQALFAQEEELAINFIDNDLAEALSQAKSENKIIFIDAYTTWCGPCKMMDKEVFTDSIVGQFFNDHFVNLKLDMEKGQGPSLATKYRVRGYPSFLFINAEETLLHQGLGYIVAERLMSLAKMALDPEKQLPLLEQKYEAGDHSEELLYNYTKALLESGNIKSKEIGKEYLSTQKSWTTDKNLEIVAQLVSEFNDPYYNFMVEKRHLFVKEFGENNVDGTLMRLIVNHYFNQIENVDLPEVKDVIIKTFPSSKSGVFFDNFELSYLDALGKKDSYIDKARKYVKKHPELSANALNELAWNFYQKIDDRKALKWATKVAKKSVGKDNEY
ncbi:MAG: thioredoxin family protein, partial [Saprospiraceae bacterium]|nr:thioredoxin family protein [Saprospiraceae bacterium]